MGRVAVVTVFIRNRGEVLLLRRSSEATTYPGRWAGVSGYVEDDDPLGTAQMEILEETGIVDVELVRAGEPLAVDDGDREWTVHPFLFDAGTREVALNEESAESEWVSATEILRRETVPDLWATYERVAPTSESLATDTEHGAAYLSIRALEVLRDAASRATIESGSFDEVAAVARDLLAARPSMAVLANRVNRAMASGETPSEVEEAATAGIERALEADDGAAAMAATLVEGGPLLTLSRSGTVVEAIMAAQPTRVLVAESRPAREGVGVAESLADVGINAAVCTDAAIAWILAAEPVDAVLVGADAVLPDGAVVNKTGTRAAALAAARESVPFYVACASDKVSPDPDPRLEDGDPSAVYDGPTALEVLNPTFDVTPADLVSGVVTERGRLSTADIGAVADELRALTAWDDRQG